MPSMRTCSLMFATFVALAHPISAQQGPPPEVRAAIGAVVAMLESEGAAALDGFATERLAPSYRASFEGAELSTHLDALRTAARGRTGDLSVEREGGDALALQFEDGVALSMELDGQGRITRLELADKGAGRDPAGGREAAIRRHTRALESLGRLEPAAALALLEREHFSEGYLARSDRDGRRTLVEEIRDAARAAGGFGIEVTGDEAHLIMEGPAGAMRATLGLEPDPPYGIDALSLTREAVARLEWDGLAERLRAAEAAGFSGVVLARRAGEVVLREAYGLADRERRRATTLETVYGIGSTPIDFTVVAAYLLADRGALSLDDPIGRFFADVPADKAGMTLRMIMEGRSGLQDFHGTPEDWDQDLGWIDRPTAVRRILAQPLLFPPGSDEAHSHSAYGLLAAAVEVASGRAYRDFVRTEILEPAGMGRTGFYGETLGLTVEDFAVGYGPSAVGLPNIPPNWGPTSWLVMGSGGMFSTLDDMDRFYAAAVAGAFGQAAARRFGGQVVDVGGSDRGYHIFRASDGATGNDLLLIMNGEGRAPDTRALTRALAALVMDGG